jgi:hypothetical protein
MYRLSFYTGFIRKTALVGIIVGVIASLCFGFSFHKMADSMSLNSIFGIFSGWCFLSFPIWIISILVDCISHIKNKDKLGYYYEPIPVFIFSQIKADCGTPIRGFICLFHSFSKKYAWQRDDTKFNEFLNTLEIVTEVLWTIIMLALTVYGISTLIHGIS